MSTPSPATFFWNAPDSAIIQQVLDAIAWNAQGLAPAIAQCTHSGEVLMLAWMNAESLRLTLEEGQVTYWSRSRQALWRKGETSGHRQQLVELRYDCDADSLLLKVEQQGPACHTQRRSCFYHAVTPQGVQTVLEPVV